MIQLSRSYRGYSALETEEAIKASQTWDTFGLSHIPVGELPEAFKRALERVEDNQFGAPNVREAYNEIKRERAEARARELQARGMSYQAEGVTFAEWYSRDEAWIKANLPEATREKMREIFAARTAKGIEPGPPPVKDCYVTPPQNDPRYCLKCRPLSGLYWDDLQGKYRCCECPGGREKAVAVFKPEEYKRRKRAGEWDKAL